MRSIQALRALLGAMAAVLMVGFATSGYAGADSASQTKPPPDCRADPEDPRCRATK